MAQRRSFYDSIASPATPMTPQGGSQMMYGDTSQPQPQASVESPDTFRRRVTPVTGQPQQTQTQLQEILAMIQGGR